MMAEDYSQARIEMLRRRWEETASPHVSLQLADLYRQTGALERAVEALAGGLEGNPGSVSLRVALGRYQIEGGAFGDAVETLRGVVEADPSHLVANKLLVKAFVHLGQLAEARDRLDLYMLVNESDPEIRLLERSVETGQALFAASRESAVETATVVSQPSAADGAEGARREPSAVHVTWTEGEPFGKAASTADRATLAAEGIFFQWSDSVAPTLEPEPMEGAPDSLPLPAPPAEDAPATMTLGRLYVEQGHRTEAEGVFRALLDVNPDHEEARAALSDLLGDEAVAVEPESTELDRGPESSAGSGAPDLSELLEVSEGTVEPWDVVPADAVQSLETTETEVAEPPGDTLLDEEAPVEETVEAVSEEVAVDPEARARARRKIEALRGFLGRIARGREERA